MQSRRWWYSLGLALAVVTGGLAAHGAAFVTPLTPDKARVEAIKAKATEIAKAATPADARKAAQDFIDVSTDKDCKEAGFLNSYLGGDNGKPGVAEQIETLVLNDEKVPTPNKISGMVAVCQIQLNMLPGGASSIELPVIDKPLTRMLKNATPAVRYWSAKTLAAMIPKMRKDGLTRAVKEVTVALADAAKIETAPLARAQMLRGLGLAGQVAPLIDGVKVLAKTMQTKAPDTNDLDVAIMAVGALNEAASTADPKLTKDEEAAAASAVANTMSFAAQHLFNGKIDLSELGKVNDLVKVAVQTLNTLGKDAKWITPPARGSDSASLLLAIDDITGSSRPGKVQEKFPTVPAPPRVGK